MAKMVSKKAAASVLKVSKKTRQKAAAPAPRAVESMKVMRAMRHVKGMKSTKVMNAMKVVKGMKACSPTLDLVGQIGLQLLCARCSVSELPNGLSCPIWEAW